MTKTASAPVKAVAQGVAILVSILIAFGIDAWWEDRQDKEIAEALLDALVQDVSRLERQLEIDVKFNEGIFDATVTMIETSVSDLELTNRELDVLISKFIWFNGGADFTSSPLDAFLDNGLIELVEDTELRLAMIDLDSHLRNVRAFYKNDETYHHDTVMPFLIENAYMIEVTQSTQHPVDPTFDYGYPDFDLREKRSNEHLLEDPRFQNLLVGKMDRYLDLKNFVYPMLESGLSRMTALLKDHRSTNAG